MDDIITAATKHVTEAKVLAVKSYLERLLEPMLKTLANPEKVIGKPYENWVDTDIALLQKVYSANPAILNDFISNKAYKEVLALEKEAP